MGYNFERAIVRGWICTLLILCIALDKTFEDLFYFD